MHHSLSPLLFALGLAEALQEIAPRLEALDAGAKLFAYLDDVVVVPTAVSAQAAGLVEEVLGRYGLVVNDKTKAWTRDPNTALPDCLAQRRVPELGLLGASVVWLDREEGELHAPLHAQSNGRAAVSRARQLVGRLTALRAAGLTLLFQPLRSCKPLGSRVLTTCSEPTTTTAAGWVTSRMSCSKGLKD